MLLRVVAVRAERRVRVAAAAAAAAALAVRRRQRPRRRRRVRLRAVVLRGWVGRRGLAVAVVVVVVLVDMGVRAWGETREEVKGEAAATGGRPTGDTALAHEADHGGVRGLAQGLGP